MNKRPVDVIRFALISPESLVVLLVIGALALFPGKLDNIGRQLKANADVLRFIPTIPIMLVVASVKYSWKLIRPMENLSNKLLYQWKGYPALRDRALASILICGMAAACSIGIWVFSGALEDRTFGAVFLASNAVPIASVFCQVMAAFKLREMLDSW